ncbi:MAG: divergent polysaccharide deacetylase family protein, partial [Candidatus Omnitrophica bacterium]|nr:divergent polysaccharide deacetylase family protein [Candidatus Omnitrophota bacterium]
MRRTRRSDSGIKGVLGFLLFAAAVNIIVTSLHKDKPGVPRFVKETVAGLTAAGGAAKKKARPQPERKRRLKQSLTDVRQKAQVSAKPKVASQPALPPAGKTPLHPEPRIAIVIDDWGYSVHNLELARSLPCPVTIAVLPNLRFSLTVAQALDAGGHEVILHLPMEARGENAPREKNTVLVGMEDEDVRGIVSDGLASVAYARGVSNHTGSRAT